jgi:hypothetical protein
MRVLVVGGYGTFGGRLVELLEEDSRLTLLIGGRSLKRAQEYCASRTSSAAKLIPVLFDRESTDVRELAALAPSLVVDASGPFQEYDAGAYRLIQQCISNRIHYVDLADGSRFVAGVTQFEDAARRSGVFVLSGVSTCPVLTAAVVHRLSDGLTDVLSIQGGIAPSPHATVGLNVVRAIASYAGRRVSVKHNGAMVSGSALIDSIRFVIAVPGRIPLNSRRFSLVDVPDLEILPKLWPQASEVWFGAAPATALWHRALACFAWLVRMRLLPGISRMAPLMSAVVSRARWGEHRGGMFVRVQGRDQSGASVTREWHLNAEGDDGPYIPSMGAAAVIQKVMSGNVPPPGARTAISDVSLPDYEKLFSRRAIYTGIREIGPSQRKPLYQLILGSAWDQLAPEIRQLHSVASVSSFAGHCIVERGQTVLSRFITRMYGFPDAGSQQEISVTLSAEGNGERWVRRVGKRTFQSVQHRGVGRNLWLVRERFGPVCVYLALVADGADLRYIVRRWTLFGVPLPLSLGPRSHAVESVQDGVFSFDVAISHPLMGLLVRYRGTLSPQRAVKTTPTTSATEFVSRRQ